MKKQIIVTCAGSRLFYEREKDLRSKFGDFDLIKADMNDLGPGSIPLPSPYHHGYAELLIEYCKLQPVAAVFVANDAEVRALEPYVSEFDCPLIMGHGLGHVSRKDVFYQRADESPHINSVWHDVVSTSELLRHRVEAALPNCGVVVVKPADSSGSRSTWVIGQDFDFSRRSNPHIPLRAFMSMVPDQLQEEYIVMEGLRGPHYTVGVLAREGVPELIVPFRKDGPDICGSVSSVIVDFDAEVLNQVYAFCDEFIPHGVFNLELGLDSMGRPVIFDVNPRISLDMGYCMEFGFSMLEQAYRMFTGPMITLSQDQLFGFDGQQACRMVVPELLVSY